MLTISDLISVLALCATFYSLGYTHGKHKYPRHKNNRPCLTNFGGHF
ncbi:MAG: hypothetical protein V8R84_00505 [Eubacterium sp.]